MTESNERLWKQGFIWGFLVAVVIAIGGYKMRDGVQIAELNAQQDTSKLWRDSSRHYGRSVDHYRVQLASANNRVHELEEKAAASVARVQRRTASITLVSVAAPAEAADTGQRYMVPGRDSTALAGLQRPGVDSLPWLVPAFFVADWQFAVATVMALDTVIQRQRERDRRAMFVIAAQDARHQADSSWIRSLVTENAILQSSRQRCGRKCGVVIGVTVTTATLYLASKLIKAADRDELALRASLRFGSL